MAQPPTTWLSLVKRIIVPITASTTPQEMAEMQQDPWSQSGKYALRWVYFSLVLLVITFIIRLYHMWGDKIRRALYKESALRAKSPRVNVVEHELHSAGTESSTRYLFPIKGELHPELQQSSVSTVAPLNNMIAFVRWIFYRPIPTIKVSKLEIVFPSLGVTALVIVALIFVVGNCFLPHPLYYSSIALGSPPLAIRAGMMAVAMVPWIDRKSVV